MRRRRTKVFAAYRGDTYLMTGTKFQLAEYLGVEPDTIKWYSTPSYRKRVEDRGQKEKRIIVVPVYNDEEE